MIKQIDNAAYANHLRHLSPMWKCGFSLIVMIFAYAAGPVSQIIVCLWMILWTLLYASVAPKLYVKLLLASLILYVFSLPAILLEFRFSGAEKTLAEGMVIANTPNMMVYIPDAGWLLAGTLLARILACVSCMLFITLTTPFPELLQVMKRLRIPGIVIELTAIMYRFIFILFDISQDLMLAQKVRGGQSGFRGRLRDTAIVAAKLFGKTMQQYQKLSYGLLARGFADSIALAPYVKKPVPRRYHVEAVWGLAVLFGVETWLRWGGV